MRRVRLQATVLVVLWAGCACAQQTVFRIDPAESRVGFTLQASFHTVHGTFRMKNSTVDFDPQTGAARGAFVVDASSGQSGSRGRDKKMHQEILESAKYPEIRFTVQQFHGTLPASGSTQVQMVGVLNLHGADHPFSATAPVQLANGHASADLHFEVPYVEWGLKNPSTLFLRVSDKVEIEVHAVGTVAPEVAAR